MNIIEAFKKMKEGKKIRNTAFWKEGVYAQLDESGDAIITNSYTGNSDYLMAELVDILSDEWEVYEEYKAIEVGDLVKDVTTGFTYIVAVASHDDEEGEREESLFGLINVETGRSYFSFRKSLEVLSKAIDKDDDLIII